MFRFRFDSWALLAHFPFLFILQVLAFTPFLLRNAVKLKSEGLEAGWLNHPISPARCHDGPTRQATRIILGVGEI